MNFYERFSNKLYSPRDIEGNPNFETFRVVDTIYEALAEESDFVGVEPFGSTMKGYSHEESDFDVRILVDVKDKMNFENIDDTDEIIKIGSEVHHRTEYLKEKAKQALVSKGFDCDKLHLLIFTISKEENTKRIQSGLIRDENDAEIVGALFKMFKGTRINEFRDPVVAELKKLPEAERLNQVQLMAVTLAESELKNFHKIQQRTGGNQDYNSLLRSRTEMWENRILKFLI